MELDIGCHCSFKECQQLDFLPIKCLYCELLFCKIHSVNYMHNCPVEADSSQALLPADDGQPKSYKCTFQDCKDTVLTQVLCDECQKQVCLKHRLPYDHQCSKLVIKEIDLRTPKEKVEDLIGRKLYESKVKVSVGRKSKTTSSKVIEMKLKMKAKGDQSIPIEERIYFYITMLENTEVTIPLFFSNQHTVGKIIDVIAKEMKLKNENHITNAKKLCLFTLDKTLLPVDVKLKDVLLNETFELNNFGNMVIKYV